MRSWDEPKKRKARVEIIPMIDIMMFLLIFFMVTMLKMIDVSGLKINVPQAASAATLPSKSLTIVVDKTGGMFFEGKPVEHDALVDQLKERARTAKLEVLVAGDKDVSLENLLHVMDVARAAGVEDIGIAAKH